MYDAALLVHACLSFPNMFVIIVLVGLVRIKFFSTMEYGFNNQNIKTSDMLFTVDWFYDQEFIIRMRQDLNPESHAKYDNIPVYWEKSHFITAMKALVEAEDQGFILEDDLIKEIGYKAVRSLVDYRYLYRRPNFGLNSDLTNPPAESKVMLTPMSQLTLNAAKKLLKKNN